jgi:hypothetical protein
VADRRAAAAARAALATSAGRALLGCLCMCTLLSAGQNRQQRCKTDGHQQTKWFHAKSSRLSLQV